MFKSKNRFLYLALFFFLAIIAILVTDGYVGVYDKLSIRTGEYEQNFEADFWQNEFNFASISTGRDELVACSYTVDNRLLSNYSGNIVVTIERNQQTLQSLMNQEFSIQSFSSQVFTFNIDTTSLAPAQDSIPLEYTLVIKRGDIERRLIFSVYQVVTPLLPKA